MRVDRIAFRSLDDLCAEIKADKSSSKFVHNRFPVRFIFLPDFERMKELLHILNKKHKCISFDFANTLTHDDCWLTADDIVNPLVDFVENNSSHDYAIFPISEIVRFFTDEDLFSTFITMCQIETISNQKQRLYIPLVGMHVRFKNFSPHFNREWGPVWELAEEITEKLPITMCVDIKKCTFNHEPKKDTLFINQTNEWMNLWKTSPREKLFGHNIVCHSETLSILYPNSKPDSFFEFKTVHNQKEIIEALYDTSFPIPYLDEDIILWKELEVLLEKDPSMTVSSIGYEHIISRIFNIRNLSIDLFMSLWIKNNTPVSKWLLKHYLMNNNNGEKYLYHVAKNILDYTDENLELELWTRLFKLEKITDMMLSERRNLIIEFYSLKNTTPSRIESIIEQEMDIALKKYNSFKEKLKVMTGISYSERKRILQLSLEANDNAELSRQELLEIYKIVYPPLYKYLSPIHIDNIESNTEWVIQYFDEYRWAKVFNDKIKLDAILNDKNKDEKNFFEWYYQLQSPHSLLKESQNDNIIWLDAIGLEWINLLYHSISDIVTLNRVEMTRANLPTTTDCNRFDIDQSRHITDFDKYMHQMNSYIHPDSFIEELEYAEQLFRKTLAIDKATIVVSDHGLSTFVREIHGAGKQILSDFKSDHEGRCVWADKKFSADTEYISVENPGNTKHKEKWAITPLRHDSLGNLPRRAVHGGASPEEVIVPFLVISPISKNKEIFNLSPKSFTISQGCLLIKDISINPQPRNPKIISEKKEWILIYNPQTQKWEVTLKGLGTGTHKLKLNIDGVEMFISIEVTGGMKMRDLI